MDILLHICHVFIMDALMLCCFLIIAYDQYNCVVIGAKCLIYVINWCQCALVMFNWCQDLNCHHVLFVGVNVQT